MIKFRKDRFFKMLKTVLYIAQIVVSGYGYKNWPITANYSSHIRLGMIGSQFL